MLRPPADARRYPRLSVPAMYSLLRMGPTGQRAYPWTGHIYDISMSGMRFELDQPVDAGTSVRVRGMLPGDSHTTFRAAGCIIRLHDDEEEAFGPTRMAMTFESFQNQTDVHRLTQYLAHHQVNRAA